MNFNEEQNRTNVIGTRIFFLLKQQGICQRKLAEKVGTTPASISRYIKGERIPKADIVKRIARALHTTVDFLVSSEGEDDITDRIFKDPVPVDQIDSETFEDKEDEEYLIVSHGVMKTVNFEKLSLLAERLAVLTRYHRKIRIVFDYDPDAPNMDFRYYIPKGAELGRWMEINQ